MITLAVVVIYGAIMIYLRQSTRKSKRTAAALNSEREHLEATARLEVQRADLIGVLKDLATEAHVQSPGWLSALDVSQVRMAEVNAKLQEYLDAWPMPREAAAATLEMVVEHLYRVIPELTEEGQATMILSCCSILTQLHDALSDDIDSAIGTSGTVISATSEGFPWTDNGPPAS